MLSIGIDIGGTTVKAGLVDQEGNILLKDAVKTEVEMGHMQVIRDMAGLLEKLTKDYGITMSQVDYIGIGIPGAANDKGFVYYATNIKWTNVPLAEKLQEYFPGTKIYVDNDANATALAEYHFGAMRGKKSGILLTLGTGIGGGIILNGKVHTGAFHTAAEIGHMVIGENFYECNCGNNGCFETFASATAIIKYVQKLIYDGQSSIIREWVKGDLNEITAKMVFDAHSEGDEVAQQAVRRFVRYLGLGIANLVNVIDPEVFVLGGGVASSFDVIKEDLKKEILRYVLFKDIPFAEIKVAEFKNDAGIIGAAMLGR